MKLLPNIGEVVPLESGNATIMEIRDRGAIEVLASREQDIHPFAIWKWNDGALYSGLYFRTIEAARTYWDKW